MAHSAPLRAKLCGCGLAPLQEPWNPISTVWPGAIVLFQAALVAVTVAPCWDHWALQPCCTVWSLGKANSSSQFSMGSAPVLVMRTDAVNPPFQSLVL